MMILKNLLMGTLLVSNTVLATSNVQQYVKQLAELGAQVETGSETAGDVSVRQLDYEGPIDFPHIKRLLEDPECDDNPLLVVVEGNGHIALNTFFTEILNAEHNKDVRTQLRPLIHKMEDLRLYAFGCRSENESFEVSNWHLVGRYNNINIVLAHKRVYT